MSIEHDAVDRVIDEAVRQMTTGEPPKHLADAVVGRIERSSTSVVARLPLRVRWRVATVSALALAIVLLLLVSRETVRRPVPNRPPGVASLDHRTESRPAERPASVEEPPAPVAAPVSSSPMTRPSIPRGREPEPFPIVPPIEIESITLDSIEMGGIDLAVLEIPPITLDPVSVTRQETP
jgi:hypothetical protein